MYPISDLSTRPQKNRFKTAAVNIYFERKFNISARPSTCTFFLSILLIYFVPSVERYMLGILSRNFLLLYCNFDEKFHLSYIIETVIAYKLNEFYSSARAL